MQFNRDYYRMLIKNNPQEAENYVNKFNGGNASIVTPKTQESKFNTQKPTPKEVKTKEEHKEYMKYLRAEYKKKFGKGVAPKHINNEEHIIGKLEE